MSCGRYVWGVWQSVVYGHGDVGIVLRSVHKPGSDDTELCRQPELQRSFRQLQRARVWKVFLPLFRGELTDSIQMHNTASPSSAGTSSSTQAATAHSGAVSHSVGTLLLAAVGIFVAICLS